MLSIKDVKKGRFLNTINKLYTYYGEKACRPGKKSFNEQTLSKIPKYSGVYIIYYKNEKRDVPLYVGRANNILKRFRDQHLNKNDNVASSSFRKKLKDKKKIKRYKDAREWIFKNCAFKFIEIKGYDEQILLEALLIKLWRKKGLYNDYKGERDVEPFL